MRKPRNWTPEEYEKIVVMRRSGWTWSEIAKEMDDTNDNVIAAFRRAVGAKHGAYKDKQIEGPRVVAFDAPVIAVMDIETLPMIIYAWQLWDQNNSIEQVITDTCMLSWAGRYLNTPDMHCDIMTPEDAKNRDTRRIAESCWSFLEPVDVVIGHNWSNFDQKHINTEFLKWDLPPLKFVVVDTLDVARRNFRFSSNKMKFINDQLGIRNKVDNDGFPLWKACSEGDPEALKLMLEYNVGDIGATEDLFYKLRPYVRNMNIALYNESDRFTCPVCGGTDLQAEGFYYTPAGKWTSYRCLTCRSLTRGKTNLFDKYKKKSLLVNS